MQDGALGLKDSLESENGGAVSRFFKKILFLLFYIEIVQLNSISIQIVIFYSLLVYLILLFLGILFIFKQHTILKIVLKIGLYSHANSLLQAMFALTPLRRDIVLAARNIDSQNEPEQADDNDEMRAARQRSETCLKKLGELFTRMGMSRLPVSTQVHLLYDVFFVLQILMFNFVLCWK